MDFLKSLKWWHWAIAGIGIVGIVFAWRKFRSSKPKLFVDTIEKEIKVGPNLQAVK